MSVAQKDGIDQRSFADQITYDDLYRRWEEGNWKATELDFSEDREGWAGAQRDPAQVGAVDLLDVLLRRGLGHRRPLPLHRRRPEGGAEVLPRHPAGRRGPPRGLLPPLLQGGDRRRRTSIGSTLAYTEPQLGWGYRNVFDRLDRMADELRRDRSLPKFAQAIALYHMVVEATLAQPGQHFIEDYFARPARCPGSARACTTSRATSSATSASASRSSPSCFARVRRVQGGGRRAPARGPAVLDGGLRRRRAGTASTRARTASSSRTSSPSGMRSVEHQVAGRRLPDRGDAARTSTRSTSDAATRSAPSAQITLMRAGVARRAHRQARTPRPRSQALLFDVIARSAHTDAVERPPMTIQWRFEDAEPWYVRIDNGNSEAAQGLAPRART